MTQIFKQVVRKSVPTTVREWLWAQWQGREYCPPVGRVRFGSLRRILPLSHNWGFDRGLPVDRYYIEQFLDRHRADIRGRVLEIADATYTRQFGGERVTQSDVLHVAEGFPEATIVADLTQADHIPSNSFDCLIFTQTLQVIYDVPAALKTVERILKPGGVLLTTVAGISKISRWDMERWGHAWSFTTFSTQRLLEEAFPTADMQIQAWGNVLTASAFLYGMAAQELSPEELDAHDPDYQVIISARVVKGQEQTFTT